MGLASDGLDLGAGLVVVCWEGVRSCIICLQSLVEAVEVEAWCWCLGWDYCPVGLVTRGMEVSTLFPQGTYFLTISVADCDLICVGP